MRGSVRMRVRVGIFLEALKGAIAIVVAVVVRHFVTTAVIVVSSGDAACAEPDVEAGVTPCDVSGSGGTNLRSNAGAGPKVADDVPFATGDSTERVVEPLPTTEMTFS